MIGRRRIAGSARAVKKGKKRASIKDAAGVEAAALSLGTAAVRRLRLQLADVRGAVREQAADLEALAGHAAPPVIAYGLQAVVRRLRSIGETPDECDQVTR